MRVLPVLYCFVCATSLWIATPAGMTHAAEPTPVATPALEAVVSKSAPEGVALTSIDIDGKAVSVVGTTDSTRKVAAYLRGLESSGYFSSVAITLIQSTGTGEPGSTSFTLALTSR